MIITCPHCNHTSEPSPSRAGMAAEGQEEELLPSDWTVIDTWRSIWEAHAILAGDDPARARAGHIRLCAYLAKKQEETTQ